MLYESSAGCAVVSISTLPPPVPPSIWVCADPRCMLPIHSGLKPLLIQMLWKSTESTKNGFQMGQKAHANVKSGGQQPSKSNPWLWRFQGWDLLPDSFVHGCRHSIFTAHIKTVFNVAGKTDRHVLSFQTIGSVELFETREASQSPVRFYPQSYLVWMHTFSTIRSALSARHSHIIFWTRKVLSSQHGLLPFLLGHKRQRLIYQQL